MNYLLLNGFFQTALALLSAFIWWNSGTGAQWHGLTLGFLLGMAFMSFLFAPLGRLYK